MPKFRFRRAHLDEEQMARFIDGLCDEHEQIKIVNHLQSCSRCSESCREAALYKGLSMSGAADLESSEESIGFTGQVLGKIKETKTQRRDNEKNQARPFLLPSPFIRVLAIAACFVVIATIGIVYHITNRAEIGYLDEDHLVLVREAIEKASMSSHLVIPGGERFIDTTSEAYRSGYIRINDSLRTALGYFSDELKRDKTSRETVYWLLGGYIATGQVGAARSLASHGIREFPDDIDMMVFDAIVSYMEGDTTVSEKAFRKILEREPCNPHACLNLAVLLYERGDEPGAMDLLERVTGKHGGSPFEVRATRIREEIQAPKEIIE